MNKMQRGRMSSAAFNPATQCPIHRAKSVPVFNNTPPVDYYPDYSEIVPPIAQLPEAVPPIAEIPDKYPEIAPPIGEIPDKYPNIAPPIGEIPDNYPNIAPPIGEIPDNYPNIAPPIGEIPDKYPEIVPPIGELPLPDIDTPPGLVPGIGNCLSPASAKYAPQIMHFIRQELIQCDSFSTLAYSNRRWHNELMQLANSSLDNAKRLLSAYYLITGTAYWPEYLPDSPSKTTLAVKLRCLFQSIQELENQYRVASGHVDDPCLGALYNILADTKITQLSMILQILRYF